MAEEVPSVWSVEEGAPLTSPALADFAVESSGLGERDGDAVVARTVGTETLLIF